MQRDSPGSVHYRSILHGGRGYISNTLIYIPCTKLPCGYSTRLRWTRKWCARVRDWSQKVRGGKSTGQHNGLALKTTVNSLRRWKLKSHPHWDTIYASLYQTQSFHFTLYAVPNKQGSFIYCPVYLTCRVGNWWDHVSCLSYSWDMFQPDSVSFMDQPFSNVHRGSLSPASDTVHGFIYNAFIITCMNVWETEGFDQLILSNFKPSCLDIMTILLYFYKPKNYANTSNKPSAKHLPVSQWALAVSLLLPSIVYRFPRAWYIWMTPCE